MEEKRYVYATDSGNLAELRSASHWCEQCVIFVDAIMREVEAWATYHGDVERLKESSASGCHMCGMILDRCKPDQEGFYIELSGKADGDLYMQVVDLFCRGGQSLMFNRQHSGQPPPYQAVPQAKKDDGDDWLAESMKMGDIYANGICNIADFDPGGCYFDGPTPAAKALYFSTREKHYLTINSSKSSSVGDWLENTPLGKRGWVVQEIVLSPRTLFYGVDGISWTATTYKSVFAHSRTTGNGTFPKMDTGQSYRTWPELVSEYTDTVLTYDSDKWLAISGLAERYMRVSDRRFVAGLDEDRLLEELGWWSKSLTGRVMNGAPTWSWLCCKSSIGMYAAKQDEMLATMITLPDKQLAALTWHTVHSSSTSTPPKRYPIRISGHVRPFCYTAQEGRWNEPFNAKFQTYSIKADNERTWMDLPLEDGTTIWGVPDLAFRSKAYNDSHRAIAL
ncbi:MAG: hypothetical protein Q9192_005054 [Flavoplaca navasiana]